MASTQFGSDPIIAGTFVDLRGMPETYRQGYAAGVEDTKAKSAKLVEAALKVLRVGDDDFAYDELRAALRDLKEPP